MKKPNVIYEFDSDKNALPMHRYAPHKLKYQIVIDIVEGHEIGKGKDNYIKFSNIWNIEKKDDKTNIITAVTSTKKNEKDNIELEEIYNDNVLMSIIEKKWGKE